MTIRCLPNGMRVHDINHSETDYLYREIFVDRTYVPLRPLAASPVVVDAGANIGLFSVFAAHEWPGATVLAFEPVPAVYEVLRENVAALAGVVAQNLALGRENGDDTIIFYPGYTMMSGFGADPERDEELVLSYVRNVASALEPERGALLVESAAETLPDRLTPVPVTCRVERLADVLRRCGVERVDLLKVDVEGAELAVLEGLDDGTWPLVEQVVVEVTDEDGRLGAVVGLLRDHGLTPQVGQAADYHGTDLFLVHAAR